MDDSKSNTNKPQMFKYDVFLSHSSKDKSVVRNLAERLRADGIRVWLDEWVIQPGDMIGLKIEQGLEESRVLMLAMSENAFASEWTALERHTALFRDPINSDRRFVPLLLENCRIKDTLKQFLYLDWRLRDNEQYNRIFKFLHSNAEIDQPQANRFIKPTPINKQTKFLRATFFICSVVFATITIIVFSSKQLSILSKSNVNINSQSSEILSNTNAIVENSNQANLQLNSNKPKSNSTYDGKRKGQVAKNSQARNVVTSPVKVIRPNNKPKPNVTPSDCSATDEGC